MDEHNDVPTDRLFQELLNLAKETFSLWNQRWIGYSWRSYYYTHTVRVRNLALEIGRRENADLKVVECASLLHDITKKYDGKILSDDSGARIIDPNGFWRNELVMPDGDNIVTKIYREFNLFHTTHNESGAIVARRLLILYGLPESFIEKVCSVIRCHVKPRNIDRKEIVARYDLVEKRTLFDADTIDANLGLVAFFRNIQIYARRCSEMGEEPNLQDYLQTITKWALSKASFLSEMMTQAGSEIATNRYRSLSKYLKILKDEQDSGHDETLSNGLEGAILLFMNANDDPDIDKLINQIRSDWLPAQKLAEHSPNTTSLSENVEIFCRDLEEEICGKA